MKIGKTASIDLAATVTVLGGRNGAGKSRVLRSIADQLGAGALLLDLHYLCEQALIVLRSRDDIDAMTEEVEGFGPSTERLSDVQRVVGRDYDRVEWFALDLVPGDEKVADRFCWAGEQPLVPYFRVTYRGVDYAAPEMGLGEFSTHFLFWILEHYRETDDLVLLLDEPDAFLPPIGVESLLARVLRLCDQRGWRVVLTTHAEEMIAQAVEHQAFTLLRVDDDGDIDALHSADDPTIGATLLARPAIDGVLFCEDESAFYLTRALLEAANPLLSRRVSVVWGNGDGYMRQLQRHLPCPPLPEVRFAFVFDGDQRGRLPESTVGWRAVPLPTDADPDTLFRDLASDVGTLAQRLAISVTDLALRLDALEGSDAHDWVNDLGEAYGRPRVLGQLAGMWAALHPEEATMFVDEMHSNW